MAPLGAALIQCRKGVRGEGVQGPLGRVQRSQQRSAEGRGIFGIQVPQGIPVVVVAPGQLLPVPLGPGQ